MTGPIRAMRRRRRPRPLGALLQRLSTACMAAVLVVSCSFATEYTLVVRAHTYMRDEIRRNEFDAPGGEILTLYVLPNVELTTAVDLLSEEAKGGLLVEVPGALPTGDTSISLA
ncbi:MAG: hypothetical protein GVY29_11380, partial [Spirochaetes bacterium]|nr:hypothetical protein [Spirochaetota bacterium]